jgi:CHAT domain-containing protein/tetratricopeptide (TPR) repeat protein
MKRILVKSLLLALLVAAGVFAQPGSPDKAFVAWTRFQDGERELAKGSVDGHRAAYEKFLAAADLYKEANEKDKYAESLMSAARAAQDLGESGRASQLALRALPFFRDTRNRLWEAKTLNALGVIYSVLGQRDEGLKLYNWALAIFKEIDNFDDSIPVINNIGRFYAEAGEYEKALEYYNLTLPYLEQIGDDESIARVLNNIAGVYTSQRRSQKAIETYERALALHRKTGSRIGEVTIISNMGPVYYDMGDHAKALDYLNHTLPLAKMIGDARTEARTLRSLMNVWRNLGNRETAIFFGKQAVNLYQQLRHLIDALDPRTQNIYVSTIENCYRTLADLLIEAGQFEQAQQVLRMLKEEEYLEFVRRDPEEIRTLGQRVTLTPAEQELVKRYAALSQRIALIGLDFVRLDDLKRQRVRADQDLSAEEKAEYDKLSAQLEDAKAALRLFIEKQLTAELGKVGAAKVDYDQNLQARLRTFPAGTVALYTVVTPDRYRVVLTTPAVQVDAKAEIPAAALNKKIFAFRELLRNPAADPRPAGKELYDILIKPLEKQLQGAGAKTLVWSLDGPLRHIPLAALSPDGVTYLAEKYQNVILTPKTRDGISDTRAEWQVLGLGVSKSLSVTDPSDAELMITFRALPGAKRELERIIRDESLPGETGILAGKRLLDDDFTSGTLPDFLAAVPSSGRKKFTVLHLASHFRLGKNWKNSFLLLGDGSILTLEQLNNTGQIAFAGVDLVTLSACNTAAASDSTGKEVDSLAEAIQAKGGKAVLATLWSISDEGTSQLMTEFYRTRKETPAITKAEALQSAQRALIAGTIKISPEQAARLRPKTPAPVGATPFIFDVNRPFAHPYYWSPFVLIGNWR